MTSAPGSLRASAPWRVVDGFGGSRRAATRWARPESVEALAAVLARAAAERLPVVFRGAGRSYGDASLNAGALTVDNRGLARVLAWDPERGVAELEPGVTIAGLWRQALPAGWWPRVVPGTMHPTIGGCVAMNVHGKNCFKVGPFGDHVLELDLLTADGTLHTLSREREPELFRATIAGLGLLGAITRVQLALKHVESGRLRVRPVRTPTLAAMFDTFRERLAAADYLVGWVDCFATGRGLGRGLVHDARYLAAGEDPRGRETLALAHQDLPATILGVPRSLLWRPMRTLTRDAGVRLLNAVKYRVPEPAGRDGTYLQSHAAFAFLLDYVPDWRLAYGPGGFLQYQLFVPDANAPAAFAEALRLCQRRGVVSYLGVFKRHRPDEYLLSHGLDGWSLALDFKIPREASRLEALARELTALVLDAGGTFYPAKDQVVDAASFARSLGGRLERFRALKRAIDPDGLFGGDQARRLGLMG